MKFSFMPSTWVCNSASEHQNETTSEACLRIFFKLSLGVIYSLPTSKSASLGIHCLAQNLESCPVPLYAHSEFISPSKQGTNRLGRVLQACLGSIKSNQSLLIYNWSHLMGWMSSYSNWLPQVREYPWKNNINLKELKEISGYWMRTLLLWGGKKKDVQKPEHSLCCVPHEVWV